MKLTKDAILAKLEKMSGARDLSVARAFLLCQSTGIFDPLLAGKLASDRIILPKGILPTWDARCKNALNKGFTLPGCIDFVDKLKSLPDATQLMELAFTNDRMAGLFWFDRASEQLIGFVIADQEEVHKNRAKDAPCKFE